MLLEAEDTWVMELITDDDKAGDGVADMACDTDCVEHVTAVKDCIGDVEM